MNKDPKVISRARVYAETVGDMFNGFVEPLAWKTLVRASSIVQSTVLTFKPVIHHSDTRLRCGDGLLPLPSIRKSTPANPSQHVTYSIIRNATASDAIQGCHAHGHAKDTISLSPGMGAHTGLS